jgi:hypothetical protein
MSRDDFVNYFFGSTTIVGILSAADAAGTQPSIDAARAGRSWEDCVGGCYYIKPNYPGRSSHVSSVQEVGGYS